MNILVFLSQRIEKLLVLSVICFNCCHGNDAIMYVGYHGYITFLHDQTFPALSVVCRNPFLSAGSLFLFHTNDGL